MSQVYKGDKKIRYFLDGKKVIRLSKDADKDKILCWTSFYSTYCSKCGHTRPPVRLFQTSSCSDTTCQHGNSFDSFCCLVAVDNKIRAEGKIVRAVMGVIQQYCKDARNRFLDLVDDPTWKPEKSRFPYQHYDMWFITSDCGQFQFWTHFDYTNLQEVTEEYEQE